ncbi:hypothetical protein ACS0TY_001121 [Phlomoides rotata]
MAYPKLLLHSFSAALIFSLLILEVASARHSNAYPTKFLPSQKKENSGGKDGMKKEIESSQVTYKNLGFAFGPNSLLNMLPKGPSPFSGPSRRINDKKN